MFDQAIFVTAVPGDRIALVTLFAVFERAVSTLHTIVDVVDVRSVVDQRAALTPRLFRCEHGHTKVVAVIHIVVDWIRVATGRLAAGTAARRTRFGVRVTNQIAGFVTEAAIAAPGECVFEPQIVAHFVRHGTTFVEGGAVGAVAPDRRPEDDHTIGERTSDTALREIRYVAEVSSGTVGVNVQVAVRVPGESVVVTATVIEPGIVDGVGDPGCRVTVRVRGRQVKLDLCIGAGCAQ